MLEETGEREKKSLYIWLIEVTSVGAHKINIFTAGIQRKMLLSILADPRVFKRLRRDETVLRIHQIFLICWHCYINT